jgi:hypothetical protein
MICVRFLEYLINVKAEDNTVFHDRLAGLYLKITMAAKKRGDNGMSIFYSFHMALIVLLRHAASNEGEAFAFHRYDHSL